MIPTRSENITVVPVIWRAIPCQLCPQSRTSLGHVTDVCRQGSPPVSASPPHSALATVVATALVTFLNKSSAICSLNWFFATCHCKLTETTSHLNYISVVYRPTRTAETSHLNWISEACPEYGFLRSFHQHLLSSSVYRLNWFSVSGRPSCYPAVCLRTRRQGLTGESYTGRTRWGWSTRAGRTTERRWGTLCR